MTRKIVDLPPQPTGREQIGEFSRTLVRDMPYRLFLVCGFPRWSWDAIRHWDDGLEESGAEYFECSGLWISRHWLAELECSSLRPGVSPMGVLLLITLYERGHFGGAEDREPPSQELQEYARSAYTRKQYVDLIARVDSIYDYEYRALLRSPERIRLRRISFQMLEDVFAAHGKPNGVATLMVGGVPVARQAVMDGRYLLHQYSWVCEGDEVGVRGRHYA